MCVCVCIYIYIYLEERPVIDHKIHHAVVVNITSGFYISFFLRLCRVLDICYCIFVPFI